MSSSSSFESDDEVSEQFFEATRDGDLPLVEALSLVPEVDVNWRNAIGLTPFLIACTNGHLQIVQYLLDFNHRPIDYNLSDEYGRTPLSAACFRNHADVVNLLVADERMDVNKADREGQTPLWKASRWGHVELVKKILASGRQVETSKKDSFGEKTAAEIARKQGAPQKSYEEPLWQQLQKRYCVIADLIEEFDRDPHAVRSRLRREGSETLAGELFALVVYLSDGYLRLSEGSQQEAQRFFQQAVKLPMDLQMVLCNRVFGLGGSIVKRIHSERGFTIPW